MDGNSANSNDMVTASQFMEQRNRVTQNILTDIQKLPKLEVTAGSSDNEQKFDYGLIITVTFFGTLGFGMVAVMLAGLWYRLCEKRRPKNEEEEIQSDDQDYKHLQMISRSSSYNPPPSLGVASEKHEGGTDMDNSLNGVTGGCRSYRLLNGHSEEVIEIKIEKADGDVGEEYEDDGDCVRTSEPYLLQDQKSKSDARIEIDTFRSLSENSVAATRKVSETKTQDFRQFSSHENFTNTLHGVSDHRSGHGGNGVSCDTAAGTRYPLPDKLLLYSAASKIISNDASKHSTFEVHKNKNNSTSTKNNTNKTKNKNNNDAATNETEECTSSKYSHQRISGTKVGNINVIPNLELSHVPSSRLGSRENCSRSPNLSSTSVSTSPNSAASKSPCSQRSSARINNNIFNNNSHQNSQTLKTNNKNNNSNSYPGRQKGDERLYGSRASGIYEDIQRISSVDSDNRDISSIYDNLQCEGHDSTDRYSDSKNRNSTSSPHHLKTNSQNNCRKFQRPSLTRQAQIFISVPSARDQHNRRSYQLPVKESFPLSKTPPITVSHTFDMGEALSSCGNSDKNERLEFAQQMASETKPENSPCIGNRSRKLNIFKRHHSANTSNEAYSAGSCETTSNRNSFTALVQNSPKRSQEFLQVPHFQPGMGAILGGRGGGLRSDALRRSSFGDRQHPAWKSAESYHMRPELRRSFDERIQHCHPCMNQKGPMFNHSTISLQQHLMSRERSESDEHFHSPDNRRCSCVPANSPHVSSHNSSIDKQSPTNSRDSLPPPRFLLNQPEIKITGSFSTLNKMSPLLEKKRENCMLIEKKRENSLNYGITDNYFSAKRLHKSDEYSRSFDASYNDYQSYNQAKVSTPTIFNPASPRFETATFREDHNLMQLHLDPLGLKESSSPGGLSPTSPTSPLATSGRQLWDLRTTLEQSPSDNEDEEEPEECQYENMIAVEKQTSFDTHDEAPDYPFNTHGLNRVFEPKQSICRADGPISPRRKLPPTPISKSSVSSTVFEPGHKPSLTMGVGRVPMFTAASFDSSGTPDSECSGTAQIVGATRKFSSSISINDDFNTEPECFSDSSHNVRRIRNSTSSYDAANLPSSSYLTTSENTEGGHHHHHLHHHPMHANGQEGKSKGTLSAMNISQIGLQNRNSYALISREDDSLELDLLKEKIVQETERNKTSELAKSRRNAYHKRRSGQVSESLEFHGDEAPPGSNLTGYPAFVGADMSESLTSSGSLNDVDNDSSITVNRRLIPPSYRAVLPAGRDYSIDKKTDMIFREFLKTDNATILKMKYGYKSPRRMKHSPRNSPSARPMVQQADSIEETEAESGEGEPNSLGTTSSNIVSGHHASDTKVSSELGAHGTRTHLSVSYIPSSDVNSDWLTDDFLYRRTRRLLPPIKSQDSTSSDAYMPAGSAHLSRNSSINKS